MASELIWDNDEKTILRQVYGTTLTTSDIKDTAAQTYQLLREIPHKVHLIIEIQDLSKAARTSFIEAGRTLDQTVAPNQGMVVIVNDSATMQFMTKAVALTAPKAVKQVYNVGSLDEARALIAQKMSEK